MQDALGAERVGYQRGAFLEGWGGDGEMDGAAFDCRNAEACIVFLGLSALGVSDYHPPLYEEHVRPATVAAGLSSRLLGLCLADLMQREVCSVFLGLFALHGEPVHAPSLSMAPDDL